MRSRGFISLPPLAYAAIGCAVVIAGLGIALKVQTSRLETVKAEYAGFLAQTRALGEAAKEAAKKKEAEDKKRKELADADYARARRDLAGLSDAYRSLRDARSSGFRSLSAPPTTAAGTSRACFDGAELQRTLERLDAGGAGIAEEGDAARIGLDAAKRWASP